jgi:hypothetical protein
MPAQRVVKPRLLVAGRHVHGVMAMEIGDGVVAAIDPDPR